MSSAKEAQLKHLVTMKMFFVESDPQMEGLEDAQEDFYKSSVASSFLPYLPDQNISVSEIEDLFGYYRAVLQSTNDSWPVNTELCLGLVYEDGSWKMDSFRGGTIETIENNCLTATEMPDILNYDDLTVSRMKYSSEYEYEVFLNDHMVLSGGMQSGIMTMGLPLKNGANRMHIHIENSSKEIVMDSLENEDEFWAMLASQVSGFQLTLTVGEEILVDEDITGENQDKYIDFTFSK